MQERYKTKGGIPQEHYNMKINVEYNRTVKRECFKIKKDEKKYNIDIAVVSYIVKSLTNKRKRQNYIHVRIIALRNSFNNYCGYNYNKSIVARCVTISESYSMEFNPDIEINKQITQG